eukprot:1463866-Amphidinium_carterae.1
MPKSCTAELLSRGHELRSETCAPIYTENLRQERKEVAIERLLRGFSYRAPTPTPNPQCHHPKKLLHKVYH